MKVPEFDIVNWLRANDAASKYDLSASASDPVSLEELCSLSTGMKIDASSLVSLTDKQGYGNLEGLDSLRGQLAGLYSVKATSRLIPENVIITQGAIAANALLYYTLLKPGDHVICQYPTYQQLYAVPESLGAQVDFWHAKRENNWIPKIEDLKALVKPDTKLIIINNPINPTGAILPRSLLQEIINVASENGQIHILSDEVFRPVFHGVTPMDADFPPSIMSLAYDKVIVSGSLSKAYALPGIRIGWLASRDADLASRCANARGFITLSVSNIDQTIAVYALSGDVMSSLLSRNIQLAKANLAHLERFVYSNSATLDWVKPKAGTTCFVKVSRQGTAVDAEAFCRKLLEETGVLLVPGDKCFGEEFKGYVRVGFVMSTQELEDALRQWGLFMGSPSFAQLPLSS